MSAGVTIWSFTLALTLLAAWTDLRDRKIPNWLTIPGNLCRDRPELLL